MKTEKTNKSISKFLLMALAGLMFSAMTTGCGNKGGGSDPAAVPAYGYGYGFNCASCPGGGAAVGGAIFGSAVGYSRVYGAPEYELDLNFYAPSNGVGAGYSGPMMAQGILTVIQSPQSCPIPPGRYYVQTAQAFNWYNLSFGQMTLVSQNGVSLTFVPSQSGLAGMVNPAMGTIIGQATGNQFSASIAGQFQVSAPNCAYIPVPEVMGGISF
jgi:hypothetical protein